MDDINKLKIQAYDLIAQIETLQHQLSETNQKIANILQAQLQTKPQAGSKIYKAKG